MTPKVSIIVLNWNGREFLPDFLTSVLRQAYDNFNVILVDNNSTDDSLGFVRDNFPQVEIIPLDKNYGLSKGYNTGIKYALEKHNPDYLFLLNNDIKLVREDTIKRLTGIAEGDKRIGILECKLVYPDGRAQYVGGKNTLLSRFLFTWIDPVRKIRDEIYEVDIIVGGAAFFVKISVIDKIGLFDEGFSPVLSEEIDFCIRAKKSGFTLKIVSSLEVIHYVGQSLKKQPSDYIFWVNQKNYIRFMLLNAPLHLLIYGLSCEFYNTLKYLTFSIFKKKNKGLGSFSPYLINIRNLREILWKRNHRTQRLWF